MAPGAGAAQSDSLPRLRFHAMVLFARVESSVRYDVGNGVIGIRVKFESHLGLDQHQTMPAVRGSYRVSGRHHIVGASFAANRIGRYAGYVGERIDAKVTIALHRSRASYPGAIYVVPSGSIVFLLFGFRQASRHIGPEGGLAQQPHRLLLWFSRADGCRHPIEEVIPVAGMLAKYIE